ncbi:hypothetical protein K438DRAFT_1629759, partial [Mycena galopus ATCC 62051]
SSGCAQNYTVVSGDTCSIIEAKTGLNDTQLHALNPVINNDCTNLQIGETLCVSDGSEGAPPPSSGCAQTYTVVGNDTCFIIESKTGLNDTQLHVLNPEINSDCTSMFLFQVSISFSPRVFSPRPPSGRDLMHQCRHINWW